MKNIVVYRLTIKGFAKRYREASRRVSIDCEAPAEVADISCCKVGFSRDSGVIDPEEYCISWNVENGQVLSRTGNEKEAEHTSRKGRERNFVESRDHWFTVVPRKYRRWCTIVTAHSRSAHRHESRILLSSFPFPRRASFSLVLCHRHFLCGRVSTWFIIRIGPLSLPPYMPPRECLDSADHPSSWPLSYHAIRLLTPLREPQRIFFFFFSIFFPLFL